MNVSFAQTLEQERERLMRFADDCLAQQNDETLEDLLSAAASFRQTIDQTLRRLSEQLDKDELISLQSALQVALDERVHRAMRQSCERRFQALLELARHDPLTGLLNRAAFDARLNEEILRARRHGRELALVMFDVDDFKSVNDRFGHPAGDKVLVAVARAMQSSFRQSDGVFRYGGDEFVAVCPETSGAAIETVLRRLQTRLPSIGGEPVGVSWGIAGLSEEIASADQLVKLADRRLYDCKRRRQRRQAAAR